jgi:hypothetical protein
MLPPGAVTFIKFEKRSAIKFRKYANPQICGRKILLDLRTSANMTVMRICDLRIQSFLWFADLILPQVSKHICTSLLTNIAYNALLYKKSLQRRLLELIRDKVVQYLRNLRLYDLRIYHVKFADLRFADWHNTVLACAPV